MTRKKAIINNTFSNKTMKKFFFFLSAIALLGLASACVEQQEVNPNYNPETREVNANFVFNIATNSSPMTKQTAADVQATVTAAADFRGVDNATLLALELTNATKTALGSETTQIKKAYDLPTLLAANSLQGAGTANGVDKSRRVLELSIPTGVNNFMFWGKAIRGQKDADAIGQVDMTVSTNNLTGTEFSLTRRLATADETTLSHVEDIITSVLNNVIQNPTATVGQNTVYWQSYATYNENGGDGAKWTVRTTSIADPNVKASPLAEIVGGTFAKFINKKSAAVRAGSGQAVVRQIGDIVVSMASVAQATPTSAGETLAQAFARAWLTEVNKYFYITNPTGQTIPETFNDSNFETLIVADNADTGVKAFSNVTKDSETIRWRNAGDILEVLGKTNDVDVHTNYLRYFPTEFNVPVGLAQLGIHEVPNQNDNKGVYVYYPSQGSTGDVNVFDGNGTASNATKIMYPAELCYFGNSPIRVTDATVAEDEYPDGSGNGQGEWLNENSWTAKVFSTRAQMKAVVSSTRSVAMADNINYGTALMEYTVGFAHITDNQHLVDNTKAFFPDENNRLDLAPSALTNQLFYLTGILVGGQHKTVGWNYIAKANVNDNNDYIVYDKLTNPFTDKTFSKATPVPASGSSSANYVLLWDNYNAGLAVDAQDNVFVALEFVNNTGKDFWGEHNIIRKGGVFYIVGKLVPAQADASKEIAWPNAQNGDYYALPPYDADGKTVQAKRVFIQDFKTVVNFKIGPTSLQHAYVTVPDLRSAQMSLGLSVDLQWRQGLSFDVTLGQTTTNDGTGTAGN